MKRRQMRTSAGKEKLNKRLVRQTLRGYRALNKITAAERRAWLKRMTVEEARKISDELHQETDRWKEYGGDLRSRTTAACRQNPRAPILYARR